MTLLTDRTPSRVDQVATAPARRRPFQPDIEGLRAVAVLAVVAFHASIPFIGGGFVGVDVFFVISGYLITGQLLREVLSTGRISLPRFYARRARRILPAASIVLVAVAVATFFLEPLLGIYHSAQDLLATALYTTNWHFIGLGTDYLAQSTSDSPVLHFWSLAVEEQFYLAWPLIILFAAFLARRIPMQGTKIIALVVAVVSVASFASGVLLTSSDPKLAYMATQTRAWEFGVGAIVAIFGHWLIAEASHRLARVVGLLVGWIGILAIAYAVFTFDSSTPFPGWAAAVPTLGAAAVIAGGLIVGSSAPSVGSLLARRPVRYLGRVSYAWYLWHWPVLIFVQMKTGPLDWQLKAALALLALLLAVATLHLIEIPISRWKTLAKQAAPGLALGMLCMVVTAGTALGMGSSASNALANTGPIISQAAIANAFGRSTHELSGAVTPAPAKAANDIPLPKSCLLDHEKDRVVSCQLGVKGGTPVVLFGDSHAEQWVPAIQRIAAAQNWRVTVFAKAGCPVANIAPRNDNGRFSQPECINWRVDAIARIQKMRPSLIVVSSLDTYIPDHGEMLTAWNSSLDRLRRVGSPIVYLRDTPDPSFDIPTCISSSLDNWSKCSFKPTNLAEPVVQQTIIGNEDKVTVVDMNKYLCDSARCPAVRNGVLLYRDDSHITATAAAALEPALNKAFDSAGLYKAMTAKVAH